jgi:uncharacterized membrane protein
LVLWALLAAAIALRAYGLESFPIEQDELYTIRDARNFWSTFTVKPVYYFLTSVMLGVVPPEPVPLRAPAFVFAVLGVWATWSLARARFGTPAAIVSTLLVAISPWHLYTSQFARYWSLMYLLASLLYLVAFKAVEEDQPRLYALTLLVMMLGMVTHPSFGFPIAGVCLGLLLVSGQGRVGWAAPSRSAWLFLWGPLFAIGALGVGWLAVTGNLAELRNNTGRGLPATLRLVPGIVQWIGTLVLASGLVSVLHLARWGGPGDRRWAAVSAAGVAATLTLMVGASFVTDVYGDYAITLLPLLYVSIGGSLQRLAETMRSHARVLVASATFVLVIATLPGTVSHLSDGTRFDYRPAYEHIVKVNRSAAVVGWPHSIQEAYAPGLQFTDLPVDLAMLRSLRAVRSGLWLVVSRRRHSTIAISGEVQQWVALHCRQVLVTERPRLDYRRYRVELYWCAPDG